MPYFWGAISIYDSQQDYDDIEYLVLVSTSAQGVKNALLMSKKNPRVQYYRIVKLNMFDADDETFTNCVWFTRMYNSRYNRDIYSISFNELYENTPLNRNDYKVKFLLNTLYNEGIINSDGCNNSMNNAINENMNTENITNDDIRYENPLVGYKRKKSSSNNINGNNNESRNPKSIRRYRKGRRARKTRKYRK